MSDEQAQTSLLRSRVRDEVEALHRFFVQWFSGAVANSDDVFEEGFSRRFEPGFWLIPPAGNLLAGPTLGQNVRKAHGSNPDFRIAIRNVAVRGKFGDCVLATYEEWQRNALASTPPDNGRIASVVMRCGATLRWLHVHETWLPTATMDAGPYDF